MVLTARNWVDNLMLMGFSLAGLLSRYASFLMFALPLFFVFWGCIPHVKYSSHQPEFIDIINAAKVKNA